VSRGIVDLDQSPPTATFLTPAAAKNVSRVSSIELEFSEIIDTAPFRGAVRRWWHRLGKWRYPAQVPLLLLADCGGSNGYRVPLFREQLQLLANQLGKVIRVCHLPPYCSKYNPIDHRLFCHISRSLQSLMLRSVELIRAAIERTTTRKGLRVATELARKLYRSGIKASPEYLRQETVIRHKTLPQFNYWFEPQ
jgi:hypothetical protein